MYHVNGFKTKEDAVAFRQLYGGILLYEDRTPKRKELTEIGKEYMIATQATGINREEFPYVVERKV